MNSEQQYLNLYFQIHQPKRLRNFKFFDIASGRPYFDNVLNRTIVQRIARNCYLPANRLLLKLIAKHPEIKVTFSVSGTAWEQFEQHAPEVIRSFKQLAKTGSVEFLSETFYHSLSYYVSREEFIGQVELHKKKLKDLIGVTPQFFRNTELIYSDTIGRLVAELGFSGMYIDGVEKILTGRTPNSLYRHPDKRLVLIPRNYRLSDDIAFRYSDQCWSEGPLKGETFASWLSDLPSHERLLCLAMDYETFGEHKKSDSGIFDFLSDFLLAVIRNGKFRFINPSEACRMLPAEQVASTELPISWADETRDLSAWLGNDLQRDAFASLRRLHAPILKADDPDLIDDYRNLQTSDHFYYMATKQGADGIVHQSFTPYCSPYEAFMNFMNVITDLELRLKKRMPVYADQDASITEGRRTRLAANRQLEFIR